MTSNTSPENGVSAEDKQENSRTPRRSFAKRLALCAGVVLGILAVFHRPILTGCYQVLAYNEEPDRSDYAIIVGGSNCFEAAVTALDDDLVRQVVLYHHHPTRLESIGLLPDSVTIASSALLGQGVQQSQIRAIAIKPQPSQKPIAVPLNFIRSRPAAKALLFCDEHKSREVAVVVGRLTDESTRRRIRVVAIPSRTIHNGNWWKSMAGLRAYFDRLFNLAATVFFRETGRPWKNRTFKDFRDSAVALDDQ